MSSSEGVERPAAELPGGAPWGIYAGNVGATLIWAVAFVVGALAVDAADPIVVAAQRYLIAGIAFAVVLTATRAWVVPTRRAAGLIAAGAVFGVLIYNIGFFVGLAESTVARGTVIIATLPAWALLLDSLIARRLPPRWQVAGVVLSFAGVLVLFGDAVLGGGALNIGDAGFMVAPISWAVYSVFLRKTVGAIPMFTATAYSVMAGGVLLVVLTWLAGLPGAVSLDLLNADILYLGVISTVVAFGLWFKGIAAIGTARASIFINLVPIWGLALAGWLLGETIDARVVLALALVLAGVVIVQTTKAPGTPA